jgi:V/A-type H+-transporting ATPase subunit I
MTRRLSSAVLAAAVPFLLFAQTAGPAPRINDGGIVIHGGVSPAVSPGSLADLYGSNLAASPLAAPPGNSLPPALGGAAAFAACAVACEGPMALLEALLSLGNVLSYARLAALGLASVMLAEVANGMPAALPGGGGVALAIMLHAVNFTLGVVSPGIAALRLQVVEFFEKFYCEGGRPYRPFAFS